MRFALLVLYAAGTLSAPVLDERYPQANFKVVECSGSRFRPGATFEYEYGGETVHRVEGTTKQETGLQLNAKVLITHVEGCAFHMKVTNVVLLTKSMDQETFTASAESAAYRAALTKHDLLFTMRGNAVTSVHPHAEEDVEMLNIKRGILSTLNLDETTTTESDVHGTCEQTILKEGDVVVKSKQLSECSERAQEEIGIQSSSIKTGSNMKPLDSKSTCTYSLKKNGDIKNVVCEETHLFRPFSGSYEAKTSGAVTAVKQTLRFITLSPVSNLKLDRRQYGSAKPMTYDHSKTMSTAASLPPAIEVVMKRLVEGDDLSVKDTSANEFTSLVRMVRKLDKREMKDLWDRYFDCTASKVCDSQNSNMKDLFRQYMLDAIAYCGTATCVSVVKDVTMNDVIAGERANMFLQSIALVAKTDNEMIRDILEIAQAKPTRQVFLTLGTLISRHCSKSPEECDAKSGSAVVAAENFLVKKLGDCSGQEDHERVEEILLVLKAIGNAKRPSGAQSAIIKCGVKSQHSNVTMSAFEALRDMPCADSFAELNAVIGNEHMDADTRIFAFRSAMRCSSTKNLQMLVHQYNIETNKQLASYMWTYFTNLLESSNPDDKDVKAYLAAIVAESPLKSTDLSMFKYSKHFEKSLYVDQTGATAKADLIFHPDGFLPKTAAVDVSAKVMGVPMDIVQTAVGIDGVETVLENMFGPDGAIPTDFAFKMFDWTVTAEKLRELAGKEDQKSRQRRAASSKRDDMPLVNNIDDTINMKPVQPSGFMSLRIMGQEVRMMSYDDIFAMIDQIDNMNVITMLMNVAKGGKKTFSKSVMFLEMTHTVPTGLGLPLKLALSGSTVGTVDLEGKFDIRNMFWGRGALDINGHVKSSAVVEIAGSMSTESNFVSTGLRVMNNMMVSNMIKGAVLYKSGQILKINVDTPEKPVQLFKMSSKPFMFVNEKYTLIEGTPRMINKDVCLKSKLIGYGLCTSVRVPLAYRDYNAPYFPLTGPAHVGISFVRGDDKLSTFQFLTTMTKKGSGVDGVVEFSTPGATYERKVNGKMSFSDVNNEKKLTLSTERFGKSGSLMMSYNTVSHRTSVEVKNNFLTPKVFTTRATFFNQTASTGKQMGVKFTAEYDWYKFNHVTKFVVKGSNYTVEAHTEYMPRKSVTAAFEFDTAVKQMKAIFDVNQIRQAVEMIARVESVKNEQGVLFTFVHIPTSKSATFYTGFNNENHKKEFKSFVNVLGKQVTNTLGWYKNKDIQSIENVFTVQGKSAKVIGSWENRDGEVALQFRADVFGRSALSTVVYSDRGIEKFIDVSAKVMNTKVSTSMILTNSAAEKSLLMRVNSAVQPTDVKFGYYDNGKVVTLLTAAKGFNSRVQVFASMDRDYKTAVGFKLNEYTGGVRVTGTNKEVCGNVYYKATAAEKTALKACAAMESKSHGLMTAKDVKITIALPTLEQEVVLDNQFFIEQGHTTLMTVAKYNGLRIVSKTIDLVYRGVADSSIAVDVDSKLVKAGVKLYAKQPQGTDVTHAGVQFKVNDNTVLLLNKYQTGKIATSIIVNDKPLPMTTEVSYNLASTQCVSSFAVKMGDYSVENGFTLMHGDGKFGYEMASGVFKKSENIFGVVVKEILNVATTKIQLVQKAGVTIEGKDYTYGWTLGYDNLSTDMKRAHAVNARIHYSNTKSSTVTFTMADSVNKASLNVDVEYVPTKHLSHYITFNKNTNALEASVEFLPKMFAKLSSTVVKGAGYMLQTRASLQWSGFNKNITIINTYINNDNIFMISTNFAKDLSIGVRINKVGTKSVTLFGDFFGNEVKCEVVYEQMNLSVKLIVNDKVIFQVKGGYDQWQKAVRIFAAQQEKVIVELKSSYNKWMNSFNLALSGVNKWVAIYTTKRGKNLEKNILNVEIMGKPFAKVIVNSRDRSLSILTLQGKRFSINCRWVSKSKTLVTTVKTHKTRMMLNIRADWENNILAVNGFFNKERVGMKVFYLKKSVIMKITLAPGNIMKAIFTNNKNQLTVNLLRIIDGKSVSKMSYAYALDTKLSELMFTYNAKLVNQITEFIRPLVAKAVADVKEILETIKSQDKKFVEISKDVQAKIESFVKKLDKSIQEFDIEPIRAALSKSAEKLFTEFAEMTVEFLKNLAAKLDSIKENTPQTVEKMREMIKSGKVMLTKLNGDMMTSKQDIVAKINIIIEMIEKLAKQGQEMIAVASKEGKVLIQKGIARGQELINKGQALVQQAIPQVEELIAKAQEIVQTFSVDIEKRLVPVRKVIEEILESAKPVVEKLIQLSKDFKVRGKRVEEILIKATAEARQLIKVYVDKIVKIIAKLEDETVAGYENVRTKSIELWSKYKVDSLKTLTEVEEYLMKLNVPGTKQNVTQVVKLIRAELIRLIQWVRTVDMKQIIQDTKTTVTNIVQAKTERFAAEIDKIVAKYEQLRVSVPKATREIVDKVVAIVQAYLKDVDVVVDQIVEFAKPMQEYLKIVEASVTKHFGPLIDQITVPDFLQLISTIQIPDLNEFFEKEIRPILMKLKPAYKNAVKQIRKIKVGDFRLGPLFDMQMREVRAQLNEAMITMKKEMINLRKMAFNIKSQSPRWFIKASIDASVQVINQIVSYVKFVYKNKDAIMEKAVKKVDSLQKRLNEHYEKINQKSFDEMTEQTLKMSGESVQLYTAQLSDIIKQLIAMDISTPTWKAITDIDVKGRIEKLAVTSKIQRALRYAKQANVTEMVISAIKSIQELINLSIKETSIKAIAMYKQVDEAYKYLKSVPKKEYEAWLNEAAAFTMSTRDMVELKINKIYTTTKTQAAEAQKFLAKLKKEQGDKYAQVARDNMNKVREMIKVVSEKSQLVYKDVAGPSANVYAHYKNIVVPVVEKYIKIVMEKFNTEYTRIVQKITTSIEMIKNNAETMWKQVNTRVSSEWKAIKVTVERILAVVVDEYRKYAKKYGNLTWEQIIEKVQTGGLKEFKLLKDRLNVYYTQLVQQVEQLRTTIEAKATEFYEMIASEAKALLAKYESEYAELKNEVLATIGKLRNEAMAMYTSRNVYEQKFNDFKQLAKVEIEQLRAQLEVAIKYVEAQVKLVEEKVTAIYNDNKNKTMKQIVDEVRAILTAAYLKHEKIVKAIAEKNFDEAKKQIAEVQTEFVRQYRSIETQVLTQYRTVETQFKTVVLPELKSAYKKLLLAIPELKDVIDEIKREGESIFNQLLEKSVIMGETIEKELGPRITWAKNFLQKYVTIIRTQFPELLSKWEEMLKKAIEELSTSVQECLNLCEKRAIKMIGDVRGMAKDVVEKASEFITTTIAKVQKKVIDTIHEIRTNPKLKETVELIEAKYVELTKMIEELVKNLQTNPTLIKLRSEIKEKITELKGIFMEEFDRITTDPKFVELRLKLQIKVDQIKALVEEAIKNGKAFAEEKIAQLEEIIAGPIEFIEQKFNEVEFLIMAKSEEARIYVAGLEKKLQPIVEDVIATLRQIAKSGKFTAEQLQVYASPYVKQLMTIGREYAALLPELTKEAIKYFKADPKAAFWQGVHVAEKIVNALIEQAKTVTSEDVQKVVLEFYTEIVAKSDEIYAAVTDQWTKDAIAKIQKYIEQVIAKIEIEAPKVRAILEGIPDLVKAYIKEKLPILKEMYNARITLLKNLVDKYVSLVKVALAENYGKIETLVKDKLEIIRALVKDTSVLVEKYVEMTREAVEKYIKNLPFLDNKFWEDIVAEIKSHEVYQLVTRSINFAEEKVNELIEYINTQVPIVEKQLQAMKVEAMEQIEQLKSQGRRIYRRSVEQAEAVVGKYEEIVAELEEKYTTLVADMTEQYKTIVAQAVLKYEQLVKTAQKVYNTVTIEEIVAYVEKQSIKMRLDIEMMADKYAEELKDFVEVVKSVDVKEQMKIVGDKVKSLMDKFVKMVESYQKELQAFVEEYKVIISKMDVKTQLKVISAKVKLLIEKFVKMMEPYDKKVQEFVRKYGEIILAKYDELSTEAIAQYENISAQVIAQYKTLSNTVVAQYEKYVVELKEKYGDDVTKVVEKVKELIAKFKKMTTEAIAKYEKLSEKMTTEIIAKYEKVSAEVISTYETVRSELKQLFKEIESRTEFVREELLKRVQVVKDVVMSKVATLKTMTIQQTIDFLAKIPADLKVMAEMTIEQWKTSLKKLQGVITEQVKELQGKIIEQLKKLQGEITEKLNAYIAKGQLIIDTLKARFEIVSKRVEDLLNELELKVDTVFKILLPYVVEVREIVLKVQNEIVDTVTFAVNYYNLGEKFDTLKTYVIGEIMKIVGEIKENLPIVEKVIRQYIQDYRHQLKMSTEEYSSVVRGYAMDAQDFTATTYKSVRGNAIVSGDEIMRNVHKGLRYLETVNKEMLMSKLREFVEFLKTRITIIHKEGQVIVKMIHPKLNLRPALAHITKVVKTQAQLTYKQIESKGMELLAKIESELPKLKARMNELKKQIRDAVLRNTLEIRRDLNISYKINKNIAIRLYNVISRVVSQKYATQLQRLEALKTTLTNVVAKGQLLGNVYWKQFVTLMERAYGDAEKVVLDISSAPTPKAMYEKLVAYINKAIAILKTKYEPTIRANFGKLNKQVETSMLEMKSKYETLKAQYPAEQLPQMFVEYLKKQDLSKERLDAIIAELKETLTTVSTDVEKTLATVREALVQGVDINKITLKVQEVWDELMEMLYSIDVRGTVCKVDPELCQLIDEGIEVHKNLLNKYLAYLSVGKARVDRIIRLLNTKVTTSDETKYEATAMIMGNRIMTFDGKLYDMVGFTKGKKGPSPCSYLLARDFKDKKFTLSKLDNAIIVETANMKVKIRNDGQTRTTVAGVKGASFGLPMEVGKSRCIRKDNLISCHFEEEGVRITVDTKNDFTTVSVSGWYKGKSQGLFGTINNEAHDEWRLPTGMIAKNINEFTNAYELSGKSMCKLDITTDNVKPCDGKTSKMCAAYFDAKSESSPYKAFFAIADPAPFMEACVRETKCMRNRWNKAHCGVVAAYVGLLRTKGVWDGRITNECMMERGRKLNEEWIQKPNRHIDVVVMVSQHEKMGSMKKQIPSMMLNLHKNLRGAGKFNVRYALIGFGGNGVHEGAHSHALRGGKTIFGYIHDLRTAVKSMPFEGTGDVTNDGYHAILNANNLKFRPGAEKIFIMFNTVPHRSHPEGPSFAETKFILEREANAPLFVFDDVNFQRFGASVGRVIGQTERKLYTSNNLRGITSKDLEMPSSEFKDLVLLSKGGLFSNNIKNTKQTAASLFDAVSAWVKADMTVCKRCTLRGSWTGQSRAVCVSDPKVRC